MKTTEMERCKRGRPPAVSNTILADLREQLLLGRLAPGMRLPRRQDMQRIYGASASTVQRAMDQLIADGIAKACGRAGTFVVDQPPHLIHLALVFPAHRQDAHHWRRLYDVLATSASLLDRPPLRRFLTYCGSATGDRNKETDRLRADMRAMRLGGVIHVTGMLPDDLLMWQQELMMPFVVVTPTHLQSNSPAQVEYSYDSFFERAIEFLAERGRRRVAIVADPDLYHAIEETRIDREAEHHGVEIRSHWRQLAALSSPVCARPVTHLLFRGSPDERPDGLIVADDNLGPHAVRGLQDAGVRIGTDLDVVVHANLPGKSEFGDVPVTRLGFDAGAILVSAVRLIDRWRETGVAGGRAEVKAVFEGELEQASGFR